MITLSKLTKWVLAAMVGVTCVAGQEVGVQAGNTLKLTFRGLPDDETARVSGAYRVGEAGSVRLPYVGDVRVAGLAADRAAVAVENAYRKAGIYTNPTVEAVIVIDDGPVDGAVVSVGGQVVRPGRVPYRRGMRLVEALQAAGDRTPFGSRNIEVLRKGRTTQLDFRKPETKNYQLQPNDVITVKQIGMPELDRG